MRENEDIGRRDIRYLLYYLGGGEKTKITKLSLGGTIY